MDTLYYARLAITFKVEWKRHQILQRTCIHLLYNMAIHSSTGCVSATHVCDWHCRGTSRQDFPNFSVMVLISSDGTSIKIFGEGKGGKSNIGGQKFKSACEACKNLPFVCWNCQFLANFSTFEIIFGEKWESKKMIWGSKFPFHVPLWCIHCDNFPFFFLQKSYCKIVCVTTLGPWNLIMSFPSLFFSAHNEATISLFIIHYLITFHFCTLCYI